MRVSLSVIIAMSHLWLKPLFVAWAHAAIFSLLNILPVPKLTADILLNAYAQGYFPMAEKRDSKEIFWFMPEKRGILPLDNFHQPKSLQKFLRKHPFTLTLNKDFSAVIHGCATTRPETWINLEIERSYQALHRLGYAHSIECWNQAGHLVGGLYGIALQGAFFGESMFSTETGASKVALAALVASLIESGYILLDTQYVNSHLLQFGVTEIPKEIYQEKLAAALEVTPLPLQLSASFV